MRKKLTFVIVSAGILAIASCSGGQQFAPNVPSGPQLQSNVTASCGGPVARGFARCFALVRTDIGGGSPNGYHGLYGGSVTPLRHTPKPSPTPTTAPTPTPTPKPNNPPGYGPADLQSAYNLASASSTAGSAQTVAIVDAYNDPTAESDLGVYRSQFGLPACTTANGCFKKVNQSGSASPLPSNDAGWAQEISLDLDMVSAICPNCHILLVEANSNNLTDLGAAVNEAAALGANAISNSYGGSEDPTDPSSDTSYFNHPGIAITVSSGDNGYGVQYPGASQYVTAVGGTSLSHAANARGWSETVWNGAGSGCSADDAQPSWQSSVAAITALCGNRAVADVSAVADPNTGVAVYDSTRYFFEAGWQVFGGTSVASPIIASVYALAGNAASVTYGSYSYGHTSSLYDVISGSNGSCGNILCKGASGWDGPTGNGTPNGTGGF